MKSLFLICAFIISSALQAQNKQANKAVEGPAQDAMIQERLITLALQNPSYKQADALANGAKYSAKAAKGAWLNALVVSGNLNEFVINNTSINGLPASTLYPKYNVGMNIPLGIFGRQDKNIAKENLKNFEAQKEATARALKKEVLIRYENYKEKKELLELQKQVTEGQFRAYEQAQKAFANNEIDKMEDVNKEYELWIESRSKQRTKERDFKIAELELEEVIGIAIAEALSPNYKK